MENRDKFNYTYSAKEQEEIKAIRKKYEMPKEAEDKITQLRRLDAAVSQKATSVALIFGIVGAIVMGSGMSLIMTDIGKLLGVGIVGIVLVCLAYPVYNIILKKERKKNAAEIIRLTDELMK